MPRLARLDAPGVLHHVMGRGIEPGEPCHGSVSENLAIPVLMLRDILVLQILV